MNRYKFSWSARNRRKQGENAFSSWRMEQQMAHGAQNMPRKWIMSSCGAGRHLVALIYKLNFSLI
jgi:hypothetical protein